MLAGIWPFVPANSTVPSRLVVVLENAGFTVELVFNVPLFVSVLLHVNPKVDKSNVVADGIVKAFVTVMVPAAVFVPLVLVKFNVA